MTTNTVTQTQGFQITTAAGAYIGAPHASLAAAGTALAGMAPGNYAIIPVYTITVTAPPVVVTPPATALTGSTPTTGAVGTKVTFQGSGLAGATSMKIGTVTFTPTSTSAASVTGVIPAGAVTGNMAVKTAAGNWVFNNSLFTVTGSSTTAPPVTTTPPVTTSPPLVPSTAMPALNVTPLAVPASMPYWKVSGSNFVDITGKPIYCEGMDLSGLENTAIQGWDPANNWGDSGFPGMPPVSVVVNKWGAKIVRVCLNTASLAGLVCVDGEGKKIIAADPSGTYKADLDEVVLAYTAANCFVVIVEHWSAPFLKSIPGYPNGAFLAPEGQGAFADTTTGPYFTKYLSTRFKNFTNVAIEGFNENFLGTFGAIVPNDINQISLQGGTCSEFVNSSDDGADYTITETWNVYGWQAFVNDARSAGFTGPLIIGTPQYDQDLSGIPARLPSDPLRNFAIAWHCYPQFGSTFGTPAYALPNYGPADSIAPSTGLEGSVYTWIANIQKAGYCVIVTEYGGQNSAGTVGEPFTTAARAQFKALGLINIAWAGMCTADPNNVLFADTSGTPTPGFGEVVFAGMSTQ